MHDGMLHDHPSPKALIQPHLVPPFETPPPTGTRRVCNRSSHASQKANVMMYVVRTHAYTHKTHAYTNTHIHPNTLKLYLYL